MRCLEKLSGISDDRPSFFVARNNGSIDSTDKIGRSVFPSTITSA
ncbi:hypothetical protein [Phormidium sp. CCY1219]|nr:hypothetical protein [Phormidium sp. CCY1219]